MKKIITFLTALFLLAGCSSPPIKTEKPVLNLPAPSLVPAGFLIIEPELQRFVDLNLIRKKMNSPHLVYFDSVTNLTQAAYVYPEAENEYAQSLRKAYLLNCQSQGVVQLSQTYYSDYWGKGKASAIELIHNKVVKSYTETPLHLLGKLLCAELYTDKKPKGKKK